MMDDTLGISFDFYGDDCATLAVFRKDKLIKMFYGPDAITLYRMLTSAQTVDTEYKFILKGDKK